MITAVTTYLTFSTDCDEAHDFSMKRHATDSGPALRDDPGTKRMFNCEIKKRK